MAEFDELPEQVQDQILDILWGQANYPKEVAFGVVNDWISDTGNPDWTADEWLEEAKRASL